MKKLVIIFAVSVNISMIVIILQRSIKFMNDKMKQVVKELRKVFKGSIEFYDIAYAEQYKIEYCLAGLYLAQFLSYDYIKEKDTKEIVLTLNTTIAKGIHNHFYK